MRNLSLLLALFTLPSLAQAKHTRAKADPRVTVVEDEPVSQSATQRTAAATDPTGPSGSRMEGSMRAPEVARAGDTGEAISRAATAAPDRGDPGAASGAALDELIARQMRRNAGSIDGCVAEAVRRHPAESGSVQLAVVVSDKKVRSVHVTADSVHDIDLDACLVKAGLTWKLQLASASFTWPVTLSPSASR